MGIQEAAIQYFRVLAWKDQANKTKLGEANYIDPNSYNAALRHYQKQMLPSFDGTLASAKQIWPEQFI